jgi:hypothetical protein
MSHLTHVKWIGPNSPQIQIKRNNDKLFLTKSELKDLHDQITKFMEDHPEDFKDPNINWSDSSDEY